MEDKLTQEELKLMEHFAREIYERKLSAPAIFFLEGIRPMNFILSQGLVFFSPLVKIIFDRSKIDQVQELLEKREAIPYIIDLIEKFDEESCGSIKQTDQIQDSRIETFEKSPEEEGDQ
jgi:hypothetical protein